MLTRRFLIAIVALLGFSALAKAQTSQIGTITVSGTGPVIVNFAINGDADVAFPGGGWGVIGGQGVAAVWFTSASTFSSPTIGGDQVNLNLGGGYTLTTTVAAQVYGTIAGSTAPTTSAVTMTGSSSNSASGTVAVTINAPAGTYHVWARNSAWGTWILTGYQLPQTVTISPTTKTVQAPATVTFTAAGGQNGYVWGGSASGSGSTNPVTFNAAGTYTVTVYSPSSSSYTLSNTAAATITVTAPIPIPVTAAISVSPTSANTPGATTVSWNSTNATAVAITGSGVNIPNGAINTPGSQAVSGLAAGSYTYTITAQGQNGPAVATATFTVTTPTPAAAVSSGGTINFGQSVSFSATSSPNPSPSFNWWSNGASLQQPAINSAYPSNGASLTITPSQAYVAGATMWAYSFANSSANQSNTASGFYYVNKTTPAYSVTANPTTIDPGQAVTVHITASNPYSGLVASPTGTVTISGVATGSVALSGGAASDIVYPSSSGSIIASYPGDSNYNANSGSGNINVNVNNALTISAAATGGGSVIYGYAAAPTGAGTAAGGSGAYSYQWYSNNSPSNSGGAPIGGATSATYSLPTGLNIGTYYRYVIVTDSLGTTAPSNTLTFTVTPAAQVISVTPTTPTITAGQSITFAASSGQNAYVWGGSASGSGTTQSVTFPDVGTYTVTVYSAAGGNYSQSNTATATITVNPNAQTVALTPATSNISAGQSVSLTASGAQNGYIWGGSASGSGTTQTLSFPNIGSYTATVLSPAGGNYSQSNTASASITVGLAAQTVTITPTAPTIQAGQAMTFTETGAFTPTVWGGQATGTGAAQAATFYNIGTYTVYVYAAAQGNFAQSNTAVSTITVTAIPQTITVSPTTATIYAGQTVTLTAAGGNTSYSWGGTASGMGTTQTLQLNTVGTFTVTVVAPAAGNYSQSNTASSIITVKAVPKANVQYNGSQNSVEVEDDDNKGPNAIVAH